MEAGKEQLLQTVEDRAKLVLNRNIFFCLLVSVLKYLKASKTYIHGVVILVYVYRLRIRLPQMGLSVTLLLLLDNF